MAPMFFVRECPTCARPVRIRVQHLGRVVACEHCRAEFQATEGQPRSVANSQAILDRADELLRKAQEAVSQQPRTSF